MVEPSELLFVGTHKHFQRADSGYSAFGIYAFRLHWAERRAIALGLTVTPSPGWLTLGHKGKFLYAVNEVREPSPAEMSGVSAFVVDKATGGLEFLNFRQTPPLAAHCALDATSSLIAIASFGGGSVHLFPIEPNGHLGDQSDAHVHSGSSLHPQRQTHPHAHAVVFDPFNRFLFAPDLGADRIFAYRVDLAGKRLIAQPQCNVRLAAGSGPRHLTFSPTGRFAYLINEISALVTAYTYDGQTGTLREIQTIDILPEGFAGFRSGAEIELSPGGRFLFVSSRSRGSSADPAMPGLDCLTWFAVDADTGRLSYAGRLETGGLIPRSFTFDASGSRILVGHQGSGEINIFDLTPEGRLTGGDWSIKTPVPAHLLIKRF